MDARDTGPWASHHPTMPRTHTFTRYRETPRPYTWRASQHARPLERQLSEELLLVLACLGLGRARRGEARDGGL